MELFVKFCEMETDKLLWIFFLFFLQCYKEDTEMFFLRRRVSQGERRRDVPAWETFSLCQTFTKRQLSSPTLQAMSRSSSVEGRRDIPARREGEKKFSSRQEGCQGLPEDRRGNQSSHGKLTKLVSNTKKLFIYTLFLRATYICNFFFCLERCQGYHR